MQETVNDDLPDFCCSFKFSNKKPFHLHFNRRNSLESLNGLSFKIVSSERISFPTFSNNY